MKFVPIRSWNRTGDLTDASDALKPKIIIREMLKKVQLLT